MASNIAQVVALATLCGQQLVSGPARAQALAELRRQRGNGPAGVVFRAIVLLALARPGQDSPAIPGLILRRAGSRRIRGEAGEDVGQKLDLGWAQLVEEALLDRGEVVG